METLKFKSEYFNLKDTLECGQIFRYKSINNGFLIFSGESACFASQVGDETIIECEDESYYKRFFDFESDYDRKATEKVCQVCFNLLDEYIKF